MIRARAVLPDASTLLASLSLAAAVAMIGSILVPRAAEARDLVVRYDQSQLLRLPRAVADVIIGNPSIADVTVQGGNLLVVTGKSFGVTNIIALDRDMNIIQDQRVVVQRDESSTVNLTKAGVRQSFSCAPNCSPTLTIGDDPKYFEENSKQATTKSRISEQAPAMATQADIQ